MESKKFTFEKFIKDQLKKWENLHSSEDVKGEVQIPVITVSSEPGSLGSIVAEAIASRLEFNLFNREIIKETAQNVKMSATVIESIAREAIWY